MGFDFEHKFNNNINLSSNSVGSINKVNNMFQNQMYESVEEIDYSSNIVVADSDINWEENLKKGEEAIDKATEEAKRLRRVEEEINRKIEQLRQETLQEAVNKINTDGVTLDEVEDAISLFERNGITDEDKAILEQLYGLRDQLKANEALAALQDGVTLEEVDSAIEALKKLNPTSETKALIADLKLQKEKLEAEKDKEWYDYIGDYVCSRTASEINFGISILKGVGQFGEALVDGVTMIGGGVASIGTGIYDAGQAIHGAFTGNEWESATKAMWTADDGIMSFVSNEYVNDASDAFYQTAVGEWLDDNAYGWFKSDGVACEIGSATGYVTGVVLLTVATGGVGGAAVSSTAISTSAAGVAATGKAASKNFNAIKNDDGTFDEVTGAQVFNAVAGSYASGGIEAATWYLTYGTGAEQLGAAVGKINSVSINYASKNVLSVTQAKMGIQFGKTVANAQVNALATGKDVDWHETLVDATVNAAVAGIYEKVGTQVVKAGGKSLSNSYNSSAMAKNNAIQQAVNSDGGFNAGEVTEDVVLSARQEFVKYTIEKGTSKVGGKAVKETYTEILTGVSDMIS